MMNKKTILEALVAILMLLLPTAASAYDIVVDGIYYDLVDGNAVVTNNGQSNCYSGDIVIPGDITHNGQLDACYHSALGYHHRQFRVH